MKTSNRGSLLAALSYTAWGLLPLFWKLLVTVAPLHILAFRIAGSLLFVGAILILKKDFSFLRHFKDRRERAYIVLAAVFVTFNWGLFIWAINSGRAIQSSLGYYINPLISIVLGMVFFKEKLFPLQWAAFVSATVGVIILTALTGVFPLVSMALALSFGLYGLTKKKIRANALEGLGSETLAALPFSLILLFVPFSSFVDGSHAALFGSLSDLERNGAHIWTLLALAGPATAIPLLLFASAAHQIPLSSLGFIQFISPTLTLFLGIFVFKEPFPKEHLAGFIFVWTGVILYSASLLGKGAGSRE
jgi:chloramphenicol-sensitive protein RarD